MAANLTPVIVDTGNTHHVLYGNRNIIRTSSNRLYYFFANSDQSTSYNEHFLEVHTSENGDDWRQVNTTKEWLLYSQTEIAVDSQNVIHMIAFDRLKRPYYQTFNTSDSLKGDNSWGNTELLEIDKYTYNGMCSIAIDSNDIPHIIYQLYERYKGRNYMTLHYANRIGGAWNKISIWPKENKINAPSNFEIAIGPDNIPYILMGTKILKGNANNASFFEEKNIDGIESFVIHKNGDVRVSLSNNGFYANYVHDHTQAWDSGWNLYDSVFPYQVGKLILVNDFPYHVRLSNGAIWAQREFQEPALVSQQPFGHIWETIKTRWSFYPEQNINIIDIGTTSWVKDGIYTAGVNYYWYVNFYTGTEAAFSVDSSEGLAPFTVQFLDKSGVPEGQTLISWAWDFDNDGIIDSTIQNPFHTYTNIGKYTVSLTVTDSLGNTDTKTVTNYIEVTTDNDVDGVFDSKDNCLLDYNATQVDLDKDGIGDVCDEHIDLISNVVYSTGLKSATSSEINSVDVTSIMKDGFLDQSTRIQKFKNRYDILDLRTDVDATDISSYVLSVYVSNLYESAPQVVNVYAYNADGFSLQSSVLSFELISGWNDLDLTQLLHLMDGFGFIKFRIVVPQNWIDVSEAWVSVQSSRGLDDWEINVEPQSIDFGSVNAGGYTWADLKVSNIGSGDLKIGMISTPSEPFRIISDECSGRILSTSESCSVQVDFRPTLSGDFNSTIKIPSNDWDNYDTTVSLTGSAPPAASIIGQVTDAYTGLPLSNVKVSVNIPRSITLGPGDYRYSYAGFSDYLPLDNSDLRYSFSLDQYNAFAYNDGNKVYTSISNYEYNYCLQLFKIRNPLNKFDQFRIEWNGISGDSNIESIAQSFKPGETGKLTKISLFLGWYAEQNLNENFSISVRSSLTEPFEILAYSDPIYMNAGVTPNSWVDFYFSNPVILNKDQTYYLLINKVNLDNYDAYEEYHYVSYLTIPFENSNPYTRGQGFLRRFGIWKSCINNSEARSGNTSCNFSLPFKLYIDNALNQEQTFSNDYIHIKGTKYKPITVGVWNDISGSWEALTSQWIGTKNEEDRSFEKVIDTSSNNYYDENGWVSVWTYSKKDRNDFEIYLATDFFQLEFLNLWQSETDINGMYKISDLNQGTYTAVFEREGYEKKTVNGTLISGQTQTLDVQLTPLAKATLKGKVTDYSTGFPLSGVMVTVNDSIGSNSTTTDSDGNFTVLNITPGNFIAIFEKSGYLKQEANGTVISGETKTLDIQLTPLPPLTIAITYPQDGALINSSPVNVAGTVTNNAQVTVNDVQATVTNGDFSASIFLTEGQNIITAFASDEYGQTASQSITVTFSTAPIISNIAVSSTTTDSATITWTTDQPTSTIFEYGTTTSYENTITNSEFIISHSITLSDLTSDTTYHFRIISNNTYGLASSSMDNTFTTKKCSATTIGDYRNITVMEFIGDYNARTTDGSINSIPRQEIAKEFFKTHPDEYDFFVIFTNFDFSMPDSEAKAFYLEVKNDIQGIGKPIFDNSSLFGSNSKLQGTIDMGNIANITTNPIDPKFEETLNLLAHEQMHRWGANVKFKDESGNISTALLGKDNVHWSYLLDSDASVLYGNDWIENGDGTFTSTGANRYYSSLDLYLIGIYDKTHVPPMLLVDNTSIDPTKMPEIGATISGTAKYININDIIAAEGERIPDASQSQKIFKTAFLFITKPGTFNENELPKIENIINAWAGRFRNLTDGKASIADIPPSITIAISSPSDGETITRPDVMVRGVIINSTGNETGVTVNGIVANVYGNQFVANHVPLVDGVNTITITAIDTDGNTATTSINVNALTTVNYIRLTSNIESGILPMEVILRIDGSFSIENSSLNITGPIIPEIMSSTPDEYTIRMKAEGIYYITASVTGPDNILYEDTIAVIVLNKSQMDRLLRGKWEGMKGSLANQDVEGGLKNISKHSEEMYRYNFELMRDILSIIVQDMGEITMKDLEDSLAEYDMTVTQDEVEHSYYIEFIRDHVGIWKINFF
ncbi:MAG: carboxypeptidase regulatory-like domain-containing protein [Nitrospirae bacterium]|nr:carboxypeptidase regulatory-like domain-containing protein [Nitrospirota bacterium]